jgi:hypothetical protein
MPLSRFVNEVEMQKWIEKVQEREIREDTDRNNLRLSLNSS